MKILIPTMTAGVKSATTSAALVALVTAFSLAANPATAGDCETSGRDAALLLMIDSNTCPNHKLTELGQLIMQATTATVGPGCVALGYRKVAVNLMTELAKADKASNKASGKVVPEKIVCDEITKQLDGISRETNISTMYARR